MAVLAGSAGHAQWLEVVFANAHTKCWIAGKIILFSGVFGSEETTKKTLLSHYQTPPVEPWQRRPRLQLLIQTISKTKGPQHNAKP